VKSISYRLATTGDFEELSQVHRQSWREAYGPLVDAGLLAARLSDSLSWRAGWQQRLTQNNPVLVAVAGNQIVGFAIAGATRDHNPTAPFELYALYVLADWHRHGVGTELFTQAVGSNACSVWVLEANSSAIKFYEQQGLRPDGARKHYPALDAWEIRLTRPERFNLSDPKFDVTSSIVHTTREQNWYVITNYGWAVLRYEQANALLKDRRFRQGNAQWPAQNGIRSGLFFDWWQEVLLSIEGADHARIRSALMPAFRHQPIAALAPAFASLADELIDAFADRGQVEFVREFAEPYSAQILCQLLGLDQAHWPQLAQWTDDLGKSFGIGVAANLSQIEAALAGLYAYLDEVIAERTRHPRENDLVSTLITGNQLSSRELRVALTFLVFAGMETTRNQLGLAMQTLMRHPDQYQLLARKPDLGAQAVEEIMRVNPTVTWVTREAREEVEFFGLRIPQGGIVQVLSHAAGTDPLAMPEPSFDITQTRPPHLGFGSGVHHCLGHFVARTDMSVALPILTRRLRHAQPDGPGTWLPISGNTGPVRFPIRFQPEV
jgi:cytochrome P450/GNAT superfamily N-acetyltransferase